MEINKETLQMIITILQILGVPLFGWMIRKLVQVHREIKYHGYQIDSLVDASSKAFGNGEFIKNYDESMEKKRIKFKFIHQKK